MQAGSVSLRLLLGILTVLDFSGEIALAQSRPANADRVPLYFEANQGQTAGEVRFLARASGYTAYLTGRETVFQYRTGKPGRKDGKEAVVRMTLSGSKAPASIQGGGRLPGIVNYLIGNDPSQWHTSIPTYSEVDYSGVYPGVDLVYRGTGKHLEFDFQVAAGADPNKIRLAYTGASKMHLDAGGDLFLDTDAGPAPFTKPVAYQVIDGKRVPVAANFKLLANGEVGFQLGKYDRKRQLTIDPVSGPSVYYSTYLGSGSGDTFKGIAVDPAGQAFICGYTDFSSYPTTTAVSGGFPANYNSPPASYALPVGFVTALAADGTGLIYSTFVSGHSSSASVGAQLQAIAVDANGNAFVGGYTDDATFPLVSAFQTSFTGYTAGIVFELNSTGQSLVYSSFLGGKSSDSDSITAIAVDGSDNAYVNGSNTVAGVSGGNGTQSSHFPTTAGVIWGDFSQWNNESGSNNGFAVKINSAGSEVWATLIGAKDYTNYVSGGFGYTLGCNNSYTYGTGIAVDASGNVYVTGTSTADISDHGGTITHNLNMNTVSRGCTFQTQSYEFSTQWNRTNAFVVELNSTATTAVYIAYLGGNSPIAGASQDSPGTGPITTASGIAVDSNGLAYVTGTTQASNLQTTSNAYHAAPYLAGSTNATTGTVQSDDYVTVIDATGTGFAYSTYLNGTNVTSAALNEGYDGSAGATGIVLGTGGQFAISGFTDTTNFPATSVPAADVPILQSFPSGKDFAMFITKFGPVGTLTAGNGLVYSVFVGAGGEYNVDGVASNGTDVYVMIEEPTNGLTTGGAYDANNSSGQKDMIVRVLDAAPISTSISVNSASAQPSPSAQTIGLTSTVDASSTVNEGTVTYYVTNSSNVQIGSTVTSGIVSGGSAPSTSYTLPANSPIGTYTIHASYNHAGGFLNGSGTGTLTVAPTVGVTIASSPSGLSFSVSGTGCSPGTNLTTPQTLQWTTGSSCTVTFASPQGGPGTQYVFNQWADNNSTNNPRTFSVPSSATAYTANFTTQYQLTTAASPSGGGTVTPSSGQYYNSGTVVNLQANANNGYVFVNWTGSVANANSASTTVTMSGAESVTANFNVNVTIASSPTGLAFSTGGPGCATTSGLTTPQTLAWVPNSSCLVTFAATIAGATGTQYAFNQWSDNNSAPASRTIPAPSSAATYTANFNTQYQLTTAASPSNEGSASPTSGTFYNSATVVNLTATANAGYAFTGWTGTVANSSLASTTITMSTPESVTANFVPQVTITSSPTGLTFSVAGTGCSPGTNLTTPQTLNWVPNSSCTVTFSSPQAGSSPSAGTQYAFNQWADNNSAPASRTITAPSSTATYTANFNTQYQLTTGTSPTAGGSVTPASLQYFNSGAVVNLQATANTGYVFANWTGNVANANLAATTITMNAPATVTANFNVNATIASSPSGLTFSVSGTGCSPGTGLTTPSVLTWVPTSSCTVTFSTPQAGATGTQYVFSQWENSSTLASRSIAAPSSPATYTASFTTQYQLTIVASPSNEGSVSPASGTFYNATTQVNLQATANTGYAFAGWTGAVANSALASTTVTMSAAETVTANFVPQATINSSPQGLAFSVTGTGCSPGTGYTTPMTLGWAPNSSCVVTFAATIAGTTGTQYVFTQWDNSSTNPQRSITASSAPASYLASFQTRYLLTTQVSPTSTYGSISPGSEYVNAGAQVQIGATANAGYAFGNFSGGALTGATTPQDLTLTGPATVTANFVALPDLSIVKSHVGHFDQGQLGATYTISVGNNGPGPTSGTVTVADTIPLGLTLVSMSGTGWTCGSPNAANVCTTTNVIGMGGSYSPITVTVNVLANAPSSVTNSASVLGTGDYNLSNNSWNDGTTIDSIVNESGQVSVTQTGFSRNHSTGLWATNVTVTNTGSTPISGPIQLELTNLSSNATMTNNTGMFNGSPYITVSAGTLGVGASVTVSIQFQNPSNGLITYTPVTVFGVL
jgi:hypothetical protein